MIENDIFKRTRVNYNKLINYGFKKYLDNYIYECNFLNNSFKAIIKIDSKGTIEGRVIDNDTLEEYNNIRTDMNGKFVSLVRSSYKDILIDIKNNCFDDYYFIYEQANRITSYLINKYMTEPEFLWNKFPGYGVFRNKSNNKWYAIITNLDLSKLDNGSGEVEIINVKTNKNVEELLKIKGIYKAYHMNKKDWISLILSDTLKDSEIISLIDDSFNIINN